MKRQTSGKGLVLYEQVLQKNFEIIETFLNKFPVIFKKQDYFEQSIKKLNEKIFKYDQETDKIREELSLTTTILEKKIIHLKENSARSNRSSMRVSQDMSSMQERKNSIFRISTSAKENKEQTALFSKQKMQLLNQMEKKQQESNAKIEELQITISQMQEKLDFISVMNGKLDQSVDKLIEGKVDKTSFGKLEKEYQLKFQQAITSLADEKYHAVTESVAKQMLELQTSFVKKYTEEFADLKDELFGQLQKKATAFEFRNEMKEIKTIIQKMVDESVESFASKQQTKMVLLLFEKKFSKLELVMQEVLGKTLKIEQQPSQNVMLGFRKEKDGVINSFGRKRKTKE